MKRTLKKTLSLFLVVMTIFSMFSMFTVTAHAASILPKKYTIQCETSDTVKGYIYSTNGGLTYKDVPANGKFTAKTYQNIVIKPKSNVYAFYNWTYPTASDKLGLGQEVMPFSFLSVNNHDLKLLAKDNVVIVKAEFVEDASDMPVIKQKAFETCVLAIGALSVPVSVVEDILRSLGLNDFMNSFWDKVIEKIDKLEAMTT